MGEGEDGQDQQPEESAPDERRLLTVLGGDLRKLPVTVVSLTLLAAIGVLALFDAFPLDSSTQDSLAAGIGLLATLLAVAITLAIFRWTQSDSAQIARQFNQQGKQLGYTNKSLDELKAELLPAHQATQQILQASGNAAADDDSEVVPPARDRTLYLEDREYLVADAQDNSARWWADLLGRIRAVASSENEHSLAAQDLLSLPLSAFSLTATLATESRGNRRTLIITRDPEGNERVWSVFSGNGKHVIDVTGQVE